MSKQKEFIALQHEWYEKLREDGFEDIEFFDPKTGLGQGSPFLKTKRIPDSGQIRARYSTELQNHYRLARNFLCHGPLYPNLKKIYAQKRQSSEFRTQFRSFISFWRSIESALTRQESKLWELYTDGATIREISDTMRSLHSKDQLGKPPKRWGAATKGRPYSVFWVKTTLDRLKIESIRFNATHNEGINLWTQEDVNDANTYGTIAAHENLEALGNHASLNYLKSTGEFDDFN